MARVLSPRSTTPSSTARAVPTEKLISCPAFQTLMRKTTAVDLVALPPSHQFVFDATCWLELAASPPQERWFGRTPVRLFEFRDSHAHRPRMNISYLSAPSGRFVARAFAAVTITDRHPGRGDLSPAADTAFASTFALPSEGSTGSAEAPLRRRLSSSMLSPRRAHHREPTPPRSLIRPHPPLRRLTTQHLRRPCRFWAASPL